MSSKLALTQRQLQKAHEENAALAQTHKFSLNQNDLYEMEISNLQGQLATAKKVSTRRVDRNVTQED